MEANKDDQAKRQEEIAKQQEESKNEALNQAASFEELVRTTGWQYLVAYFKAQVQQFATDLLTYEDKKIEEFEAKRRELMGLRRQIAFVQGQLDALTAHRKEKDNAKAKKDA